VDFADEASERLEALHTLLSRREQPRISEINEMFRSVHSLKGLAGLAGLERFGSALHEAEDLLDEVRLSRLPWTAEVHDALVRFFRIFEGALPMAARGGSDEAFDPGRALEVLASARQHPAAVEVRPLSLDLDLPERTLTCLSEYEESRLRANLSAGAGIFTVEAAFDLDGFEAGLKALGAKLNEAGEWIATLPQVAGFSSERLSVQLLAAATVAPADLGPNATVRRVSRAPSPEIESIRAPSAKTIRLDAERLDRLLSEAEEARAAFQKLSFDLAELEAELPASRRARLRNRRNRLSTSLSRLTDLAASARTVPVSSLALRLERAAERLLEASGRSARFRVEGGDIEIDRALAEDLADPLLHLLRNATDHGIESAEERRAAGKAPEATITFSADARGPRLSLCLADDGRGIDEEEVFRRGRELGWVSGSERPSRDELFALLFRPGFSTAARVSQVSGRGVGLDLVADRVSARHGEIRVESRPGQGARFEIFVPVSRAVFEAIVVREGGKIYGFPLASVARVEKAQGGESALSKVIGREEPREKSPRLRVVVPEEGALTVDAVLGQEMIVVRPIETRDPVSYLIGVSEGSSEEAILVLDPVRLLRGTGGVRAK
jgi:two-component system chemotaxis sensor kinase CheA